MTRLYNFGLRTCHGCPFRVSKIPVRTTSNVVSITARPLSSRCECNLLPDKGLTRLCPIMRPRVHLPQSGSIM